MSEDDYLIEIDKAEVGLEKAHSALAVLDNALQAVERDINKCSLLEGHYTKNLDILKGLDLIELKNYVIAKKNLDDCKKLIQNVVSKKQDMHFKKADLKNTIAIFVKRIHSLKEDARKSESRKVVTYDFRRNTKFDKE